ncbi:uncharacterized protein BDR25DRAFT_348496 [Lindgomyces ingoldianus]|uniref:Uncharacterized protein n=1 Tax=Lindgomyces ingoldianus TaxID=673940 RepID=A0ACB6RIR7_9PLEO|nr:uncharacterized protein BDR25DRAFT_348496 [Lindgomyces ingoldianus]KAF2478235.1 hypothetical protein BDR25DRAFT_348496 [Lindgomyces ingoldianus]
MLSGVSNLLEFALLNSAPFSWFMHSKFSFACVDAVLLGADILDYRSRRGELIPRFHAHITASPRLAKKANNSNSLDDQCHCPPRSKYPLSWFPASVTKFFATIPSISSSSLLNTHSSPLAVEWEFDPDLSTFSPIHDLPDQETHCALMICRPLSNGASAIYHVFGKYHLKWPSEMQLEIRNVIAMLHPPPCSPSPSNIHLQLPSEDHPPRNPTQSRLHILLRGPIRYADLPAYTPILAGFAMIHSISKSSSVVNTTARPLKRNMVRISGPGGNRLPTDPLYYKSRFVLSDIARRMKLEGRGPTVPYDTWANNDLAKYSILAKTTSRDSESIMADLFSDNSWMARFANVEDFQGIKPYNTAHIGGKPSCQDKARPLRIQLLWMGLRQSLQDSPRIKDLTAHDCFVEQMKLTYLPTEYKGIFKLLSRPYLERNSAIDMNRARSEMWSAFEAIISKNSSQLSGDDLCHQVSRQIGRDLDSQRQGGQATSRERDLERNFLNG